MNAWFELDPDRFAQELATLEEAGFAPSVNEYAHSKGLLWVTVQADVKGSPVGFEIRYPTGYPFFRPEVLAPSKTLCRHQNPWSKNLCVVPNGDVGWDATLNGTYMVRQAVSLLETSAQGVQAIAAAEVDAPEPASAYFMSRQRNASAFLFPEELAAELPAAPAWGNFEIHSTSLEGEGPRRSILTAMDVVVRSGGKKPSTVAIPSYMRDVVAPLLGAKRNDSGVWVRVDTAPPFQDWNQVVNWAAQQVPKDFPGGSGAFCTKKLVGIIYPDEGPARGEFQPNWLLIHSKFQSKGKTMQVQRESLVSFSISSGGYGRIPTSKALSSKSVLLVGLGSLGSAGALELVRAGVGKLIMYDPDIVAPSNLVRHQAELSDVGLLKVEAIARHLMSINPNVEVVLRPFLVGAAAANDSPETVAALYQQFLADVEGADTIVVTTGEKATMRFISEIANYRMKSVIYAWVHSGAWSGQVFRAQPGDACYDCKAWMDHGRDGAPVQMPDEDRPIYDQGCGMPSFEGISFDIGSVATATARLTVQTLLNGEVYPDLDGNGIILNHRGADAGFTPEIIVEHVPLHPNCRWHGQ